MSKIFFLTGNLGYGGATKILVQLANYLSNNEYSVTIINYGGCGYFYKLNPEIKICNIRNRFENISKIRRLIQFFYIRRLVRKKKPDAIIAFENIAKLLAVCAALMTKTKVIISERKDPYNYKKSKKRYMHIRYMLADGCIFQTLGASKYYPKSVQTKSAIIPNFIDLEKKEKIPTYLRKDEIAFIARFELEQKRQDVMVRAFYIVSKSHPNVKLVFYGDGPDIHIIKELVNQYGLNDKIIFAGVVSNIEDVLRNAKIFVLTSDFEGIPNALIEAMAYGLPVVSTDCSPGGARLLINDRENGILVPVGDTEKLAEAINFLLDNPEIAELYGSRAQGIIEQFKPELILPRWKDYIDSIIKKGY